MNRNDKMYHRNAVHLLPVLSFNCSTGLLFKTRWETSPKKLEPLPNNSPNFFCKNRTTLLAMAGAREQVRWRDPVSYGPHASPKKSPKESRELKLQHRSRQKWWSYARNNSQTKQLDRKVTYEHNTNEIFFLKKQNKVRIPLIASCFLCRSSFFIPFFFPSNVMFFRVIAHSLVSMGLFHLYNNGFCFSFSL